MSASATAHSTTVFHMVTSKVALSASTISLKPMTATLTAAIKEHFCFIVITEALKEQIIPGQTVWN